MKVVVDRRRAGAVELHQEPQPLEATDPCSLLALESPALPPSFARLNSNHDLDPERPLRPRPLQRVKKVPTHLTTLSCFYSLSHSFTPFVNPFFCCFFLFKPSSSFVHSHADPSSSSSSPRPGRSLSGIHVAVSNVSEHEFFDQEEEETTAANVSVESAETQL